MSENIVEEGESVKFSLANQKWVGLLLAGMLFLGVGIFLLITARGHEPVVEVISGADGGDEAANGEIWVDITGAVNEPGVYVFTANDRVEAALTVAGGLNDEADTFWVEKNINRADKLTDGMKIYIPKKVIEGKQPTEGQVFGVTTSECVGLNSASSSKLEGLPGIGPVTAGKIISGRPYSNISELKEKKIVGEKVYAEIEAKLCLW